jgi:hypothetical protein
MTVWSDYQGRPVRLTDERQRHILDHIELVAVQAEIQRTVHEPELVIRSVSDEDATLSYRYQRDTLVGDKWLCVVIKYQTDDAFVLTAYLTDKVKKGEQLWPKE